MHASMQTHTVGSRYFTHVVRRLLHILFSLLNTRIFIYYFKLSMSEMLRSYGIYYVNENGRVCMCLCMENYFLRQQKPYNLIIFNLTVKKIVKLTVSEQ